MPEGMPNDSGEPPREAEDVPSDFFAFAVLKAGHFFSIFFLLSMAMLIYEVIMRYAFDSPTIWVHESTIFLCATCFVFGGLHSVSRNGHIRVVLVYDHVSPRVRRWLDAVIYLFCGLATAMFSYAIWPTVISSFWAPTGEFRMVTSGSAWNPPFPTLLRTFLFIALIAMTVQFTVFAINHVRGKQP